MPAVALFPQSIHDGAGPAAAQVLILATGVLSLGLGGWAALSGSD